jgi:hypothetical protein
MAQPGTGRYRAVGAHKALGAHEAHQTVMEGA